MSNSNLTSMAGLEEIFSSKASIEDTMEATSFHQLDPHKCYSIDLSGNKLKKFNIPYVLSVLPNAKEIDVKNNKIEAVLFPRNLSVAQACFGGNPLKKIAFLKRDNFKASDIRYFAKNLQTDSERAGMLQSYDWTYNCCIFKFCACCNDAVPCELFKCLCCYIDVCCMV